MPLKDLSGKRFGRLYVLKLAFTKNRKSYWLCKCDCGKEKIIRSDSLIGGKSISCGCYQKEKMKENIKPHRNSKLYRVYYGMKERCCNENCVNYKYYGGKGVKIYYEWLNDFETFYDWATNNGYKDGLTIDRIDVNGDYSPENCRWITHKEQMSNTTANRRFEYNGENLTISELAEKYNINRNTLNYRINMGWNIEKAINFPTTVNYLKNDSECFENK